MTPAPQLAEQQRARLTQIAEGWLPLKGGDYHSVSGFNSTNSPPTAYAVSYGTQKLESEVWSFYARKCGFPRMFDERQSYIVSGQNDLGNYSIVERMAGTARDDSIFTLRSPGYTVTATFRAGTGKWQTTGSVVVVLDPKN